jgi:hypothetical protein
MPPRYDDETYTLSFFRRGDSRWTPLNVSRPASSGSVFDVLRNVLEGSHGPSEPIGRYLIVSVKDNNGHIEVWEVDVKEPTPPPRFEITPTETA